MSRPEPVAVVGIGCRFPGGIDDASRFWTLAVGGARCDRRDSRRPHRPRPLLRSTAGHARTHHDALGRLPRRHRPLRCRLLRHLAARGRACSIRSSACCSRSPGRRSRTPAPMRGRLEGSRVRRLRRPVAQRLRGPPVRRPRSGRLPHDHRQRPLCRLRVGISYALGLRGPSVVDRHRLLVVAGRDAPGRAGIRAGECELALAGGVNVILQPHISIAYSQSRMMAPRRPLQVRRRPRRRLRPQRGRGRGGAQVAGAALAGRRSHLCVDPRLRVNNDGQSSGSLGTPSRAGQRRAAARRAYARRRRAAGARGIRRGARHRHARRRPGRDSAPLGAVLGAGRAAGQPCLRRFGQDQHRPHRRGRRRRRLDQGGAVRCTTASIPPSLHFDEPNPAIDWAARHGCDPARDPAVAGPGGFADRRRQCVRHRRHQCPCRARRRHRRGRDRRDDLGGPRGDRRAVVGAFGSGPSSARRALRRPGREPERADARAPGLDRRDPPVRRSPSAPVSSRPMAMRSSHRCASSPSRAAQRSAAPSIAAPRRGSHSSSRGRARSGSAWPGSCSRPNRYSPRHWPSATRPPALSSTGRSSNSWRCHRATATTASIASTWSSRY